MNPDLIILCGGAGTRLSSVVNDRQKCVANVAGEPFLSHVIRHVCSFGRRRIVLCTGHQAETVRELLPLDSFDAEFVFSFESEPLGTGGAILKGLRQARGSTVMAMNGDSICSIDLIELERFHSRENADFTMVLAKADGRGDAGNVEMDEDTCEIRSFVEKKSRAAYLNAGIYCFNRKVFDKVPENRNISLELDVLPSIPDMRVLGFKTTSPLMDIGTPDRYRKISNALAGH